MSVALEFSDVSYGYAERIRSASGQGLRGVSFRVEQGEVCGLAGHNGSGKSTVLRLALGLLRPNQGVVRVFGQPAGSAAARARIGYLPEAPCFYRFLTGRELVMDSAALGKVAGRDRRPRVDSILDKVGLLGAADRRIETYSKGMLQRVGMAQALVHDPDLVILDEPCAGLDQDGLHLLSRILEDRRRQGKTVLLTSHLFWFHALVCDRWIFLEQGRAQTNSGETALPLGQEVSP